MVFGLFSKDRALKRAVERSNNKLAQSVDRWAAMEKLREIGNDEALYGLCRRFSFTYDKLSEDESEKKWVVDVLVSKGSSILPTLTRYMKNATSIAHPLMVLEKITDGDETIGIIDTLLADEEPGYTRNPAKRTEIINWLAEWNGVDDEAIAQRIAPYLADFDENVRFAATEAIALHPHESAAEGLVAALIREEEESKRLRIRIAEVLAEHQLSLSGHKDEVSALFDDVLAGFALKYDKLRKK